MNGDGVFNNSDYVGNANPMASRRGRQADHPRGYTFDPGGGGKQVNHGLQFGRQSWRRQPPN